MEGGIFTQRHEWCLTVYSACNSMLTKTCKEGQGYINNICGPSLLFTIPSTRHMCYQTIPRTNRIWHFCQACWFKLPYQLKRQESSASASPYTHLIIRVKISSTTLPGTFHQAATVSWYKTISEVELPTLNLQVVWNCCSKSLHLKVQV